VSSALMSGAEIYTSRMLLLLAPVSTSALSRFSKWLTMRLVLHYQLSDWRFGEMVLLEPNSLEKVNKFSSLVSSSILMIKLISVESMDSALIFLLLTVFSHFNCLLNALFSSKRKAKDYFPAPALASKQNFF
jgi:hypothetical protein